MRGLASISITMQEAEARGFLELLRSHKSRIEYFRAKSITELILERAGPAIFETFSLEVMAFRLIPVTCLLQE